MIILILLTWVRNIAKFRFSFLFANIMLLSGVITAMIYSIIKLSDKGMGPDIVPINYDRMFSTLGFAIYTYEGIGIIMPCMQACDCKEEFDTIYKWAMLTITIIYLIYGTLTYLAYGDMEEQIVF